MYICKKCPKCGCFNDILTDECVCGHSLAGIEARAVADIPMELYGNIDEEIPLFVQVCPFCQTENYTADAQKPVTRCRYCRKKRVEDVVPVPVGGERVEAASAAEVPVAESEPYEPVPVVPAAAETVPDVPAPPASQWEPILCAILGVLPRETSPAVTPEVRETPEVQQAPRAPKTMALRLTAVGRLTGLSETILPEDAPVLLGRYAADLLDKGDGRMAQYIRMENFFQQDTRISSYHCHLIYEGNVWYVRDGSWAVPQKGIPQKPSKWSTQVNDRDVVGSVALKEGDVLKLGNQPDSVGLRVEIVSC